MDTFVKSNLIEHRVAEFTKELPPLEEIHAFYSLDKVDLPSDRPYTWSNTISSLDGVVSMSGQGKQGVEAIGLKVYSQAQAKTDFCLLASGWAYSDVILFSAASLRAEPEQKLLILSSRLIKFRIDKLGKLSEQPDVAIVTANGWLDTSHVIWATDRRKLVATSEAGFKALMTGLKLQLGFDEAEVKQWLDDHQINVKAFQGLDLLDVNLVAMMQYLKHEWHADLVDVSAGPTLVSLMMNNKLMDECRYTTSGMIAGKEPVNERPQSYPENYNRYKVDESPVLEVIGIRLFGPFHVYHRGRWLYRH